LNHQEVIAMKAYSSDLRLRVLKDCDGGMTNCLVALKYDVSESWVRRLKLRRRETGEVEPRPPRNGMRPKWLPLVDQIQTLVCERPDITLKELRDALGGGLSIQAFSRAAAFATDLQKKVIHAAEQDRADVQAQRAWWQIDFDQAVQQMPLASFVEVLS
jgi:transposase